MYKAVKNCGRIVEFAKQDEKTLMRWAAGILAREGRKITTRDMELFLTKTGTDMGNIRMELEKLICKERHCLTEVDHFTHLNSFSFIFGKIHRIIIRI